MRPSVALPLALLGIVPISATAQHGVLSGASGASDCNVCHASHTGGAGVYTLRLGEDGPWFGRAGGGALGASSQSCLRCHGVAQVRRRQPEFSRAGLIDGREPRYLGFDFSDDHPLGRPGHVRGAHTTSGSPQGRRGLRPGAALEVERRGIECARCHDPHRRRGATPGADEEAALCGECHDAMSFGRGHETTACSRCHLLHGGSQASLLRSPDPDLVCRPCHDRSARAVPAGPGSVTASLAPPAHARDLRPPTGRCIDCHAVHR